VISKNVTVNILQQLLQLLTDLDMLHHAP